MYRILDVYVYDVDEFEYSKVNRIPDAKRKRGNPRTRKNIIYKDIICAFDIETTALHDIKQSFMYVWQFAFGSDTVVMGRTWKEFRDFIIKLSEHLEGRRLVTYVHNLSYEFSFLRGIYDFNNDDVFAIDTHKIARANIGGVLDLRCSWIHSNMSLASFTEKMNVKHQKLSGAEYDYSKIRYPWTPLTVMEKMYCINDVVGLVEAIEVEMERDEDNLYTIPITSTGYVRRDAKRAMAKVNQEWLHSLMPDFPLYKRLHSAFRGGNTHANRYFANMLLYNVKSADRKSSYPDTQCNDLFPVSKFFHVTDKEDLTVENVVDLMVRRKRACLITFTCTKVRLRNEYTPVPYISISKCEEYVYREHEGVKFIADNGRIISTYALKTTMTDVDFQIFLNQYDFDGIEINDLYHAKYGMLPQELRDVTIKYFQDKTVLDEVDDYLYMKSKNKLNSIYGMSAQDPVKHSLIYDFTEESPDIKVFEEDERKDEDLLSESNKRAFQPYQWGVWITAWARKHLQDAIDYVFKTDGAFFIYCDTDSVKYIGDVDWTDFNQHFIDRSIANGACAADREGNVITMGHYEQEKTSYKFKTLGAKKYCTEDIDGNVKLTLAGVRKKEGSLRLQREGGIDAFKEGFIFDEGEAGLQMYYNLNTYGWYQVSKRNRIYITANAYQCMDIYQIKLTAEYKDILLYSRQKMVDSDALL